MYRGTGPGAAPGVPATRGDSGAGQVPTRVLGVPPKLRAAPGTGESVLPPPAPGHRPRGSPLCGGRRWGECGGSPGGRPGCLGLPRPELWQLLPPPRPILSPPDFPPCLRGSWTPCPRTAGLRGPGHLLGDMTDAHDGGLSVPTCRGPQSPGHRRAFTGVWGSHPRAGVGEVSPGGFRGPWVPSLIPRVGCEFVLMLCGPTVSLELSRGAVPQHAETRAPAVPGDTLPPPLGCGDLLFGVRHSHTHPLSAERG